MHVGSYNHPAQIVSSRESLKKATDVLRQHYVTSPSTNPARLKNLVIGDFLSLADPSSAADMSEDNLLELWESLKVVSTPQKIVQLLKSIWKDNQKCREFETIRYMQSNVTLPYIHRYMFPGHGSINDCPHVFKMSTKGAGSGVDLLRKMAPDGSLHKTGVTFDVMRRITSGWLTMGAHIYDHNYRALYTIFTCELRSEDALSQETVNRQMLSIVEENGVKDVHIEGFVADNAQVGWIAVKNIFFEGIPHPEKKRSDAFYFYQSLHRYTTDGIIPSQREEHKRLWDKLWNARNYAQAYEIANEISDWWSFGNCIPGKEKMLQGWMAWWVVRWRQWGNLI